MKSPKGSEVKKIGFRNRIGISDFGLAKGKIGEQDVVVSA